MGEEFKISPPLYSSVVERTKLSILMERGSNPYSELHILLIISSIMIVHFPSPNPFSSYLLD